MNHRGTSSSKSTAFRSCRRLGHSAYYRTYAGLFISLALAFVAATGTGAAATGTAAAPRPNVVFFLADDYGWADIGYHGHKAGLYKSNAVDP
jgi:hypothetical protein